MKLVDEDDDEDEEHIQNFRIARNSRDQKCLCCRDLNLSWLSYQGAGLKDNILEA